jgi:HPt (histidine-containing phosphotransfer) domain-containing protein
MPSADPFAEMCEEYRRSLAPRLARIEALWHAMAEDPEPGKEELLRTVHSIAGAAGTFGLAHVGATALALELHLEPLCSRSGPAHASERARIEAGIAQLVRDAAAGGT